MQNNSPNKWLRPVLLVAAAAFILIIVLATRTPDVSPTPSVSFFPVQKEVQTTILGALLQGELVLDNGCLRVHDELILWPYGYSLKTEDKEIRVIDDRGQSVAHVGHHVRLGGGQIPAFFAEEKLGHPLPEGCDGPYFLAGEVVTDE